MFFKRNPSSKGNDPVKTNGSLPKEKLELPTSSIRVFSKDRIVRSMLILTRENREDPAIHFSKTSQIQHIENKRCMATGDDPNYLLHIPRGHFQYTIEVQIQSSQKNRPIYLYYSHDKALTLHENNKVSLGKTDGQLNVHHLVFPAPVYWLRVDPTDGAVEFEVQQLTVACSSALENGLLKTHVGSSALLPLDMQWQNQKAKLREPGWESADKVLFVTHELSGTGAPLLCRKMSRMAQQLGKKTIILCLPSALAADENMIDSFREDCDILIICRSQEDVAAGCNMLRSAGVKKAVLNSVVCGSEVRSFCTAGMRTVCLIHEMKCSSQILRAEKWIEDLAQYAHTLVFPARCVLDDFTSFGSEIKGSTIIMPQGLYRNLDGSAVSITAAKARKSLLSMFHLPADSMMIMGVGSINFGKGTDLLPLIAKEMDEAGEENVHFLWLGQTNEHRYEVWLLEQIRKMGLAERFHFLGYISDESEYMNIIRGCSALALVSREDSYPSVMLEAMSSGIPVVAFRGSGGAEELLDDERGYLVEYLNIRKYAQVLRSIRNAPEKTKKITDHASAYIANSMRFDEYVRRILDCLDIT
jgi:hypothetical protein